MKYKVILAAFVLTIGSAAASTGDFFEDDDFFGDDPFFEDDSEDDDFFEDNSSDDFFGDDSFFGDDPFFSDDPVEEPEPEPEPNGTEPNMTEPNGTQFQVSQGGQTFNITPLEGDVPVEDLYGFNLPPRFDHGNQGLNGASFPDDASYYESTGTEDLQRQDTTISFLYKGPDGLSFVVVHDSGEGDGGSATWNFTDMPEGQWVVKDDLYLKSNGQKASTNYDSWNVNGSSQSIDWIWGSGGTDGGAYTVGDEFDFSISPAFNEDAELWNQHYSGEIDQWQFISGDRENPDRIDLELDEEVSVKAK